MDITRDNLQDFVRGAALLGTGGGGDPYIGRLMLQQEMGRDGVIQLMDPQALDDDALVICCATMGAPTVMFERIPSARATVAAIRKLEERLGRKMSAVMPIEAGGINATLPLIVAAQTGLPVVDADGMGRAFPELQMVTFGVYGCSGAPIALTNDHGDSAIIESTSNLRCEQLARSLVVAMGGQAQIALYPLLGRAVKEFGVLRTLTLATRIGEAIARARDDHRPAIEALLDFLNSQPVGRFAKRLFDGKIADVERTTSRGFAVGRIRLQSIVDPDEQCIIDFQNEFLVALVDDKPLAMVPDLVCILDGETGEPITTEAVRYGQRVAVIGVSVPAVMRTLPALATFGPSAFGYSHEYVPIEVIHSQDS